MLEIGRVAARSANSGSAQALAPASVWDETGACRTWTLWRAPVPDEPVLAHRGYRFRSTDRRAGKATAVTDDNNRNALVLIFSILATAYLFSFAFCALVDCR